MKSLKAYLVLTALVLQGSTFASDEMLKETSLPKSLKAIEVLCETNLKTEKRAVQKKVNCMGVQKYKVIPEIGGEDAADLISTELGFELTAAKAKEAISMLSEGMIKQLATALSGASDAELLEHSYIADPMRIIASIVKNAEKGGHSIWIDRDSSQCVGENVNVVFILDNNTNDLLIISHGNYQ